MTFENPWGNNSTNFDRWKSNKWENNPWGEGGKYHPDSGSAAMAPPPPGRQVFRGNVKFNNVDYELRFDTRKVQEFQLRKKDAVDWITISFIGTYAQDNSLSSIQLVSTGCANVAPQPANIASNDTDGLTDVDHIKTLVENNHANEILVAYMNLEDCITLNIIGNHNIPWIDKFLAAGPAVGYSVPFRSDTKYYYESEALPKVTNVLTTENLPDATRINETLRGRYQFGKDKDNTTDFCYDRAKFVRDTYFAGCHHAYAHDRKYYSESRVLGVDISDLGTDAMGITIIFDFTACTSDATERHGDVRIFE